MAAHVKLLSACFLAAILLADINGERTKDKMYETIQGAAACFRRLNGTHQFGCSSSRSGNVGVVHIVNTTEDLDWLLESASAGPYMVVLLPTMFDRPVLKSLQASAKVSGVVLADIVRPTSFSPEDRCPNRYSGLSTPDQQTCSDAEPVNPAGSGMLLEDWGFPLFHVDDDDTVQSITECFSKHNAYDLDAQHSRALCSLEMNAYMFAAVDSDTCIRRSNTLNNLKPIRYCDPLGDQNVFSTLFPRPKSKENATSSGDSRLYVLATRMDATSMFDWLVSGAATPTTGVVTLLATADMLARMFANESSPENSNVLFLLLHGESYDYIGSSRLVYDMKLDKFPTEMDKSIVDQPALINLDDITLMLELGQISNKHTLFTHHATINTDMEEFLAELSRVSQHLGLPVQSASAQNLPPASIQSFIKENASFPGILLTDHDKQYTNKFYHSIYDDAKELGYEYANASEISSDSIQRKLSDLSVVLAHTLYNAMTKREYTGLAKANVTLVDELLRCYLNTTNCTVFHAASTYRSIPDLPASNYVGVHKSLNPLTVYTALTLAWLTGEKTARGRDECKQPADNTVFDYVWMNGYTTGAVNDTGVCVKTTVNYTVALSPAFVIDGYAMKSGLYSTWTESVWQDFSVRMFLKASRGQEAVTLAVGLVVLVVAFIVTYFVERKADILFGNAAVAAAL